MSAVVTKWIVRKAIEIDGVMFQLGDVVNGGKTVINKTSEEEGVWLKSANGKKIAIPLYALAADGTPEAEAAIRAGKSLLNSIIVLPPTYKLLPVVGLMAGMGFAKYKGGGFKRYACYGLLFTAITAIPAAIWIWKNMSAGSAELNKALEKQVTGAHNQKSQRTPAGKEEQEKYATEITNALADLTKLQTGIPPESGDLRAVNAMLQSCSLTPLDRDILIDYIGASAEIAKGNMNENETEETMKPLYDRIGALEKQIAKDENLQAIVNKLTGK